MEMTPQLKQFLVDNHGLSTDADDATAKSLLGELVATGGIDLDKVKELSQSPSGNVEQKVQGMIDSSISQHFATFKDEIKGMFPQSTGTDGANTKDGGQQTDAATGHASSQSNGKSVGNGQAAKTVEQAMTDAADGDAGSGEEDPHIRVKSVVEQFDDTRTAATYDKSSNDFLRKTMGGKRVNIGEGIGMPSRYLDMPTERSKAVAGAWFKRMIGNAYRNTGRPIRPEFKLTELDQKLIEYAVHECKFVGPVDYDERSDESPQWYKSSVPTEMQRKALLDDSTSDGLEAVPIEFDDAVIITPLLEGELFPLVTIRNVTRRRIEGFSIGNPTISWGTAEGSAISLFTTTSFISAFDTTIYPVAGAMEVGLDFLADSPNDIGSIIIDRYGSQFRKEMDDVIADGSDSSSQPEGLFQASSTTTVNSENGSTGDWTVSDIESLLFGVAKQYRQEAGRDRAIFLSNETTYQRWHGIEVGTADQRRVLGMNHESYRTLNHPHKINEDLGNQEAGFFCLNRYRFYRRAGFGVRIVTEDQTLARKNMEMIVVRARVGGQLELGGAGAVCSDGMS